MWAPPSSAVCPPACCLPAARLPPLPAALLCVPSAGPPTLPALSICLSCSFHKGYLSVNFSSNYYMLSQRHADVPRLTPAHLEVGGWVHPARASEGRAGACVRRPEPRRLGRKRLLACGGLH